MLYFNTLFEGNPAPVAYHVSPDKPMNFPSKPANNNVRNNTNANMSKPASSSGQRDTINQTLVDMDKDSEQQLQKDLQA